MNQEKKIIRILQPAKNTKKVSPILFGIIGTTFGVIATSILIFTFLNDNSSVSTLQTKNNIAAESKSTTSSLTSENITTQINQQANDDLGDEHEGFNQPQPKMNEINQVFQHKKEVQVGLVSEPKPSGNPFDTFNQQPKPINPFEAKAKPNVIENKNKAPQPVPTANKPAANSDQITTKTTPKNPPKNNNKEADYEVPHATVQIAVTRSMKE